MRKREISILLTIFIIATMLIPTSLILAGNKNQNTLDNGNSVERGTGKINHIDGCRPPAEAVSINVFVGIPAPVGPIWAGAKCCASNELFEYLGTEYPLPNQCCNPPDDLPDPFPDPEFGVPGNHCLCFENRGFVPI